jgi:nucleotide-binding universal stress UspA family protein
MYRSVLVAYDDSEGARRALARAAELARTGGGALTVVEVISATHLPFTGAEAARRGAEERAALRAAVAELPAELGAEPWVISGSPAAGVLTVAEEIGADLIVAGTRARRGLSRAVLGSVAGELAAGAPCDVLVVHPG